jgi:hypothetical protein
LDSETVTAFSEVVARYKSVDALGARARLTEISDHYSQKAKNLGYLTLIGASTVSGLSSILFLTLKDSGEIDPEKLPEELVEAFQLQYPNVFESGGLNSMTLESANGYLNGWSGKYTEVIARDTLNDGGSIGGFSLDEGEVAVLATNPNQELWDMMIEPSGKLFQVKATESVAYVKETLEDLDGTEIDVISTNLPGFDVESNVDLMELAASKDQIDDFMDSALSDAADDFGLDDLLGPIALLITAGTTILLIKKVREDLKQGVQLPELYKSYGPKIVGRAVNIVSPVPFSGFFVAKYLRGRVLLEEAVRVASQRVARANKLLTRMSDAGPPN